MTTNEERHEIAEEMRQRMREGYSFYGETVGNEIGVYFSDYDDLEKFCEDCWKRLAELIDPEPERTCKNLHKGETDGAIFVCSECDAYIDVGESWSAGIFTNYHDFSRNSSRQIDPSCCLNCHAKVVDDE